MQSLFDRRSFDSWAARSLFWGLGCVLKLGVASLILLGLVSMPPLFDVTRGVDHAKSRNADAFNRQCVQRLQEATDPNTIWVCRRGQAAEKVDVGTGIRVDERQMPGGYLPMIEINDAGNRILFRNSSNEGLSVGHYERNSWELSPIFPSQGTEILDYAICPVDDTLVLSSEQSLEVWSIKNTPRLIAAVPTSSRQQHVGWSQNGHKILTISSRGELSMRHRSSLALLRSLPITEDQVAFCAFSADGNTAAVSDRTSRVVILSFDGDDVVTRRIDCKDHIHAAVSPDRKWIAMPKHISELWLFSMSDTNWECFPAPRVPCCSRLTGNRSSSDAWMVR
jgi:hypothetical protein